MSRPRDLQVFDAGTFIEALLGDFGGSVVEEEEDTTAQ